MSAKVSFQSCSTITARPAIRARSAARWEESQTRRDRVAIFKILHIAKAEIATSQLLHEVTGDRGQAGGGFAIDGNAFPLHVGAAAGKTFDESGVRELLAVGFEQRINRFELPVVHCLRLGPAGARDDRPSFWAVDLDAGGGPLFR
jgi:hypothetical protein